MDYGTNQQGVFPLHCISRHSACKASKREHKKDTGKTVNGVQRNYGPQPKDYSHFQSSVNYDDEEGNSQQFQKRRSHAIWINTVPFLEARRMYQDAFQKLRTKPSPSYPPGHGGLTERRPSQDVWADVTASQSHAEKSSTARKQHSPIPQNP